MVTANTSLERLRGRNDDQWIGTFGLADATIFKWSVSFSGTKVCSIWDKLSSATEGVAGATTRGIPFNSVSKQARHTPLALTGVVHLLYLLPQLLQMDIAQV